MRTALLQDIILYQLSIQEQAKRQSEVDSFRIDRRRKKSSPSLFYYTVLIPLDNRYTNTAP